MTLRINGATFGPGVEMRWGGDLLFPSSFLNAKVTLTMKRPFELHHDDCYLGKDTSSFKAPNLGLDKDIGVILVGGIGSL